MIHLVAALICIAVPTFGWFHERLLKESADPRAKEKGYIIAYCIYWGAFGLVALTISLQTLYFAHMSVRVPMWTGISLWVLIAFLTLSNIMPALLLNRNMEIKEVIREAFEKRQHVMPITEREQRFFIFLAVTVGICEEFIFRGFLPDYLGSFGLTPAISVLLAAVVFGIGHFVQGLGAIFNSILFGIAMSYLYVMTGSLLVPILLHIVYDLKILFISRSLNKERSPLH